MNVAPNKTCGGRAGVLHPPAESPGLRPDGAGFGTEAGREFLRLRSGQRHPAAPQPADKKDKEAVAWGVIRMDSSESAFDGIPEFSQKVF